MTGFLALGPCNGYRGDLSSSLNSGDPRIKYPSRRSILLLTNDMAEPAQPLDINTLHNVYVIEKAHTAHYWIRCGNHRQLALDWRSYVGLFSRILLRLLHRCSIGYMPLHHKEAHGNGKSDPALGLQTDIIFGGNGVVEINKFIDCIVIGRILRIDVRRILR